jgi:hypothetical protein
VDVVPGRQRMSPRLRGAQKAFLLASNPSSLCEPAAIATVEAVCLIYNLLKTRNPSKGPSFARVSRNRAHRAMCRAARHPPSTVTC